MCIRDSYRMYVCFPFNFVSLFYLFISIIPRLWTFCSYTLCEFLFTLLFFSVLMLLFFAVSYLLAAVWYWSEMVSHSSNIVLCQMLLVLHTTTNTILISMLHFSFQCSHYCWILICSYNCIGRVNRALSHSRQHILVLMNCDIRQNKQ